MTVARASIKKDEAIAIAGKAAAQAAYGALGEAEKPEEGETAVRPVKEAPKKPEEKESLKGSDSDADDTDENEEDDEGSAMPPSTALRSRRHGVGIGRGMSSVSGNGFTDRDRDLRPPQGGYRARSFSGHGATGDSDEDGDHEVNQDVLRVLDSIPKDERASVLFKFRQRKTASNGKTLLRPVAELTVAGDPNVAQASIKDELAAIGPGSYDGVPHTTDGKLIRNGTHWAFKITEEEARAAGWRPDDEEDQMNAQAVAPSAVAVTATQIPALTAEDDDVEKAAKREKGRIDLLKHTLETTKLEIQLQELRQGGVSAKKSESVKDGVSEEAMKRVVEAEKARLEAETATKLAKAEAEKEKELARIKSEQERELARIKSEQEAERRKAEDALRDLKGELGRKEAEHAAKLADIQRNVDASNRTLQDQFKEQMSKLEETFRRDREKEREREKDRDAAAAAATAAAAAAAKQPQRSTEEIAVSVVGAVGSALKPIMDLMVAKMNQPAPTPPPAPDPLKQMESMANIFKPMLEKATQPPPPPPPPPPAPPPVDVMDIMSKTTDMWAKLMPKEKPPRSEEIAEVVARVVEQKLPALQAPQQSAQPQDPFAFADKLLGYAQNLSAMHGPPEREERDERDERRDEREEDPFEQAEKTLNRLERFGVKVQIGNQPAQAVEQPKPTAIQEIFAGARAMVPDIGEAVAKYMNSKQPQVDPEILRQVQIQQLQKRTGMRKKTGQPQQAQHPVQQVVQQQAPVQQRQHPAPQQVQRPPQQAVVPHRPQPTGIQRTPQSVGAQRAPQVMQPRPQVPQAPRPVAAQPTNKYGPPQAPVAPTPYNLPTVLVPQRPQAAPGFVPQEAVPFRPGREEARQQAANSVPIEGIPQVANVPTQQVQQAQVQQVQQRQQRPQQMRPQQVPAQQRTQQAVQQRPQQPPVQPKPKPTPPAEPTPNATPQVLEVLDKNGIPTAKSWSELSAYANAAISRNEDPAVAALHLLEQYPVAAKLVMNVASEMGGVDAIDTMLTNYAAEAGPYADVIGELASKVRNEGKDWATRLILALRGSPV